MTRKPRQPYSDEERSQKQELLAVALAATANPDNPGGRLRLAAEAAGLPRTTAQEWMALGDDEFREKRTQWKKAFHGSGLDLLRLMMDGAYEAVSDEEKRKKTGVRDWMVAIGTLYDKLVLAAGEQEPNGLAAFAAGMMFGRSVERQQPLREAFHAQDIEARVLD